MPWAVGLLWWWLGLACGAGEPTVLVLGSGGLIGSALVPRLEQLGLSVLQVRGRAELDLREAGALDRYNSSGVRYCFLLACEVGGSKFLEAKEQQRQIIEHNLRIYQAVLPWLAERRVRFVFSSSYLQASLGSYGAVKRLGEAWVGQLEGLGKVLRLWNVYGPERLGLKAHVLSDWSAGCISDGRVSSRTDGWEQRQFLHVEDAAEALIQAMQVHTELPPVSDASTGVWSSMRQVAAELSRAAVLALGAPCNVSFSLSPATPRQHLSPVLQGPLHRVWQSKVSLVDGCRRLIAAYLARGDTMARKCRPGEAPETTSEDCTT